MVIESEYRNAGGTYEPACMSKAPVRTLKLGHQMCPDVLFYALFL